ncbi:MAG TPA: hypothetical protein VM900_07770 [Sphingomonas sp.]|nr:hypothetical protein [Sphingomonas sp.]
MIHIAIQESQNGSPVTWMEHVTDDVAFRLQREQQHAKPTRIEPGADRSRPRDCVRPIFFRLQLP